MLIAFYPNMGGGGPTPFLSMGKMCLFPFFPNGENGKKSIWKKREKYSFPSLSIYFFPMGKNGKTQFSHGQKWGWTPPNTI